MLYNQNITRKINFKLKVFRINVKGILYGFNIYLDPINTYKKEQHIIRNENLNFNVETNISKKKIILLIFRFF